MSRSWGADPRTPVHQPWASPRPPQQAQTARSRPACAVPRPLSAGKGGSRKETERQNGRHRESSRAPAPCAAGRSVHKRQRPSDVGGVGGGGRNLRSERDTGTCAKPFSHWAFIVHPEKTRRLRPYQCAFSPCTLVDPTPSRCQGWCRQPAVGRSVLLYPFLKKEQKKVDGAGWSLASAPAGCPGV